MSKKKNQNEEGAAKVASSPENQELDNLIQEEIVIDSEENALKFYSQCEYKAPHGVDFAYVTSDKNVFWPDNGGSAKNHAFKNKLQIFKIKVNGLIESND